MAGIKQFKEKIMSDEAFAKKFESVKTPDDVVKLAKGEGFDFTVDDIKNNTELTEAELSAVAGGGIFGQTYFVTTSTIFAPTYFVTK